MWFFRAPSEITGRNQKAKHLLVMTKEDSNQILDFVLPGTVIVVPGCGHIQFDSNSKNALLICKNILIFSNLKYIFFLNDERKLQARVAAVRL